MKRKLWIAVAIGVLLVAVGASAWWLRRQAERDGIFAASVPTRPPLDDRTPELQARIMAAERRVRARQEPIAALEELSRLYHANGFYAEAIQCYEALAQLDPGNPQWRHRLAVLLAGYGKLDGAIPLWQQVVEMAPDYLPARIRLGDAYLKTDQNPQAVEVYQAVLARDSRNPYALLGLARLDVAAKRWDEARQKLEAATAANGDSIGGNLLPTVYENLGDKARATALRSLGKASGSFFDTPDPWVDGLMEDCYDVYRLSLAAGAADHSHDPQGGMHWLGRALQLAPNSASVNFQIGLHYLNAKNYAEAQKSFRTCVRVQPDFSDGYAYLSKVLATLGNQAESDQVLAEGLVHCPTSAGLHLEKGLRLKANGHLPEAIAEFQLVEKLRPDEADSFMNLAMTYFDLGRMQEGAAELNKALVSEPDFPMALSALLLYHIQNNDRQSAVDTLRRVRLQPRIAKDMREQLEASFATKFGPLPMTE